MDSMGTVAKETHAAGPFCQFAQHRGTSVCYSFTTATSNAILANARAHQGHLVSGGSSFKSWEKSQTQSGFHCVFIAISPDTEFTGTKFSPLVKILNVNFKEHPNRRENQDCTGTFSLCKEENCSQRDSVSPLACGPQCGILMNVIVSSAVASVMVPTRLSECLLL